MGMVGRNSLRLGWFGQSTPIGVVFDSNRIHWVQLDRIRDSVRLRDACSVKYAGDLESLLSSKADLKDLVCKVLRRGHFRGQRIVTHAPVADLRLMVLNYTADSAKSEPEQILGLARERMRDDLLEHVVDYVPIRTSGEKQGERSALVAVAPEDPVIEHLERLRRAGLEVEALEIAPVAIRRLIAGSLPASREGDSDSIVLVLRMGVTTTELTLLSARRLLLYRELEIGTESMIEAVAKGLDCDRDAAEDLVATYGVVEHAADDTGTLEFADAFGESDGAGKIASTLREILRPSLRAIVDQAHKAISYAVFQTRGMSIETIYLMQGTVRCPGLDGLLAEMLKLPVDDFKSLSAIEGYEGVVDAGSDQGLALALGFAMRGVVDG